jgi:hypothetical protein
VGRGIDAVPKKFARIRAYNLAAATSFISLAALATATPAGIHAISDSAEALSPNLPAAAPIADAAASLAAAVSLEEGLTQAGDQNRRDYSAVEILPSSGVLVSFRVNEPHDPAMPRLTFATRQGTAPAEEELTRSVFAKPEPAAVVMARLPQAKPEVEWPLSSGDQDFATDAASPLLAYAPAASSIEAPFDALMGGLLPSTAGDDLAINVPRARPDPDQVLTWLDGRALGQFAPGQHYWVRSKLPESVHEADEQKCLAEGIYFEARGELERGQAAVAQVILNRVRNPAYPDTICEVVYQNQGWRNRCQFSFACDGVPERVASRSAWRRAVRVAEQVTDGEIWLEEVGDATHYHANYVRPAWGPRMIMTDRVGEHLFYRTRLGGWS